MSEIIIKIIAPLSALLGVALTILAQSLFAKRNQSFELQKEQIRLSHNDYEKRMWLVRERLEKLHIIVGEISREFSLTFLVIDWETKIKRADYHKKYRALCVKLEEAQMISDLYIENLSDDINSLSGEMNCYWGSFAQLLYLEERGDKVDHNSQSYKEAFNYSHSIPQKAYSIKQSIRSISRAIMSNDNT